MDVARCCRFETTRLDVDQWHAVAERRGLDLAVAVSTLLTEATTLALPPSWQGNFSHDRAVRWIAERDDESPTLLIIAKDTERPVGLVILFESPIADATIDLRIGYLFAEDQWGRGFASELVAGLVGWARLRPAIRTMTGGVAPSNPASARVLSKAGFDQVGSSGDGELIYQHVLDAV